MDFSLDTLLRSQAEGKALGPNAAFMDPRPVGTTDLNIGRIPGRSPSTPGNKRLSQRQAITHLSAYGGDQAMDWVMDCVKFYSDAVANADFHFEKPYKIGTVREEQDAVEPPSDLVNLLEDPNPYQDYIEMMELLVIDLLLVGNAYWLKWRTGSNGKPLAIYRLAPPYVEINTGPWGPKGYIYKIPNAEAIEIEPDEVIHLRLANPDPKNPYFGLGIIQGAGRAADLDISLTDSQSSYFENRTMPSVAVESERRVPKDVFNKMRKQLKARSAGPRNAGEMLVLESGLKLSSIAPNAGDAGFGPLAKASRDRIFAMFHINPKLLGITDEAGSETVDEAQKQWDTKTARPFMNKLQRKLTKELIKPWSLEMVIDYEAEMTPEEQASHAGTVGKIPGVEVDEVRNAAKLGDHPDSSIGSTTLNLPGAEGGTGEEGDSTRKGFPDRSLPGEAGRPPNGGNTRAFPRKGGKLPKGSRAKQGKALDLNVVFGRLDELATKAVSSPRTEVNDPAHDQREADVDNVTEHLQRELGKAASSLERSLLVTTEGKAVSDIVEKLRGAEAWSNFESVAREAYEASLLKVMSAAAIHHDELGLKPAGDIDYEALIDDLVKRKESGVSAITKTLKDRVAKAAKEARANGADIDGIQKAISTAVSNWTENHAQTVALTAATRGYNESTLDIAEKAGTTHVLVSDGQDDDEPCIEAHGDTWTIEKARANILQHPNCRRAFVPITT